MNMRLCQACYRVWNDRDNTGVCPLGHENRWDDEELETQDHLRKLTW
jgi:hypothetical protein